MIRRATSASTAPPLDVREELLRGVRAARATAAIVAGEAGVVAGAARAAVEARELGLSLVRIAADGASVEAGDELARFAGTPRQVVLAEDLLLGLLSKPSGIATRARAFVARAAGRLQVVCGGWKKMPGALKEMIRGAVAIGGCQQRMAPGPFVYLDKSWVGLLGGIRPALAAVAHLELCKVLQIKGRYAPVESEACEAAALGADVVFVDTGNPEDAARVAESLRRLGLRDRVRLAFGGGVTLGDVDGLAAIGVDLVDVGRQIVDAPLLDLRLEIVEAHGHA